MKHPTKNILIWLILFIAFYLQLLSANDIRIDHDEFDVYSRIINKEALWQIPFGKSLINYHIVALILAKASINVLGDSLFALRWPSICFGLLSIALIYRIGTWLINKPTGLSAAILLAFNPFALYYTSNSRGYLGMMCYVLLAYFLTIQAIKTNKMRYGFAIAIVMAVAIYNHLYAALAWPGLLWLGISHSGLKRLKFWFITVGASGLLLLVIFTPLLIRSFYQQNRVVDWLWTRPLSPMTTLNEMAGLNLISENESPFIFYLLATLVLLTLIPTRTKNLKYLWGWFLFPLAIYHLGNRFIFPSISAHTRYFTFVLPFLLLLIAEAIVNLDRKLWVGQAKFLAPAKYILLLVIVSSWLPIIQKLHYEAPNGNWVATANYLSKHLKLTDWVLCESFNHDNGERFIYNWTKDCKRNLTYWLKVRQVKHLYPITILESATNYDEMMAHAELLHQRGRVWVIVGQIPPAKVPLDPTWPHFSRFGASAIMLPPADSTVLKGTINQLERLNSLADSPDGQLFYRSRLAKLKNIP